MSEEKTINIDQKLFKTAIALRGGVETVEYKHLVLSLLFLKFISEDFYKRRKELIDQNKKEYIDKVEFYAMQDKFLIPKGCDWDSIVKIAKQPNLSVLIDNSLNKIEKKNPTLKGALHNGLFSRLGLENSKLASLIDKINNQIESTENQNKDFFGYIYEYFLRKFAIQEGQNKGEFYTPKSVVKLICELIQPLKGKIYDPCCGSGGMFIETNKFLEKYNLTKNVSIYGQEEKNNIFKLAKMNMAIRGISVNMGELARSTFENDQHKNLKANYILANPPFNLRDWRSENEFTEDNRWDGYIVPPTSNANYAWILNIVSKLNKDGISGLILSSGALASGGDEYSIRKMLIEQDIIEGIITLPRDMFYNTDLSANLWILNKNKKNRKLPIDGKEIKINSTEKKIIFIDLRNYGSIYEKKYIEFKDQEIKNIKDLFFGWRQNKGYYDKAEFCKSVSLEEIKKNDYSLVPSQYIEFQHIQKNIDHNKIKKDSQKNLDELLKKLEKDSSELKKILSDENI